MIDTSNWKNDLKQLKLEHIQRTAPGFFEASGGFTMTVRGYSDKNANELTRSIIDYINFNVAIPGSATRISSTGTARKIDGKLTYTTGSTRKGTADIHAVINGRHCSIEVKVGKDTQSEAQQREQARVQSAGGLYFIARSMPAFLQWYHANFHPSCSLPVAQVQAELF
jgi:hypothetical protein